MIYYHNPRCQKSRQGLALLEENGHTPEVRLYMTEPITPAELEEVLGKMGWFAEQLLRKKEAIWKEAFADKELTDDELILAMIEYPQLMERPILVTQDKAVVGRPTQSLLSIL